LADIEIALARDRFDTPQLAGALAGRPIAAAQRRHPRHIDPWWVSDDEPWRGQCAELLPPVDGKKVPAAYRYLRATRGR
jgi:hypothetical protein